MNQMKHKVLFLLLFFSSMIQATKINVDNVSLGTALTTAANGDTLLLAGGIYSTDIKFQNEKTLTLKSAGTGSVVFNASIGGNATTDTNSGLIFEGITINRNNSYVVDGSTFGNINILAFRNDTIMNVNRCLVRGGNTTITTLGTIEITNCIIKNCGSAGYALLYPKFNVSNVIVKNTTLIRYYGGENLLRPQVSNTSNVLNFTFENNTVFKWSKSSSYALCYASNLQSTASNYTFKNNIIAEAGIAGQMPKVLNATGGNIIAKNNLIVNYGRFAITGATSLDTATNHISANLYDRAIGFQDTTKVSDDFRILSTSPLATAGTTGGPIGDPRWISVVSTPAVLSTVIYPVGAGSVAPSGGTFNKGQSVTLSATRAFGYQFKEWQDESGNVISTTNPTTVVLDKDKTIKAVFSTITTFDLTLNKLGDGAQWGKITLNPAPVNGKYETGTIVDVAIVPNAVTSFLYWEDASSSTTRKVVMDASKTISATFDVVPFIVGWDFAASTPVSSRPADYAFATDNTGLLGNYGYDGTSTSWGASNKTFGGITYNCARRYTDAALLQANTPRYLQARFSGVGYKNISIKSKISADNTTVNKVQKMQYSIDGTTFKTLDSLDISGSYNAAWVDCDATLPEMADSLKSTIYIRWIPQTTSGYMQDATPATGTTEGFYLANVFVFAETNVPNDTIAPILISTVPTAGSSTASANGVITLTFNKRVKAGTGDITFNGKILTPVYGNKTVSFAYTNLSYGTAYSFTVPKGTITNLGGYKFAGTTFSFSTMTRPQPIAKLYDAVVAKDGSGDYTTINAAISAAPTGRTSPWLIFVKNGSYKEYVYIPSTKPYIYLIGQDKQKTIIHEKLNVQSQPVATSPWLANDTVAWKYSTNNPAFVYYATKGSVVWIDASNFYTENISYVNDWGVDAQNGPQALAFTNKGNYTALYNCNLRSFQDTWYSPSTASYKFYAKNCFVEGAVDYIYGQGDALLENLTLYCVRSGSVIVAPNHETSTKYGYIFQNCTVSGNSLAGSGSNALGRPWHNSPIAIYMNTKMLIPISAAGWNDMGAIPAIFAEYNSVDKNGNLMDISGRKSSYSYTASDGTTVTGVAKNRITDAEATKYTYDNIISQTDNWNPRAYFEPVSAPTNLTVTNSVLNWTKSDYAICYVVLRDTTVIGFSKDNSFTDLTSTKGMSYTYTVKAVNEYGSLSAASNAVTYLKTGFYETAIDRPEIEVINSMLKISKLGDKSNLSLISIEGKILFSESNCSGVYSKYLPQLKGVYILNVNRKSYKIIF